MRSEFTIDRFNQRLRAALAPMVPAGPGPGVETSSKSRVLVFVEHYLPGFRAGGPMRSIAALVEQLHGEIDFYVVTRDRDDGSDAPYAGLGDGAWHQVGHAKVRYLAPREVTARRLAALVHEVLPAVVYLNGFFGPMAIKLLVGRRLGAIDGVEMLLAPRGELSPGALALKAFKKRSFLRASRWIGLHRGIAFHASTELEREEIAQVMPASIAPKVALNAVMAVPLVDRIRSKAPGAARFVFLSRIAQKKNLHLALELLRSVRGTVELDIYGPVAEEAYWRRCRDLIEHMPRNVAVTYRGTLPHDMVVPTLAGCHFFLLPTASENFGHAIVEALLAGCPVVTSDRTPWLGLAQRGVGWDIPLADTEGWRRVLQTCVDLDNDAYAKAALNARAFGNQIASSNAAAENRDLFQSLFHSTATGSVTSV